jgi:hypothetical protein
MYTLTQMFHIGEWTEISCGFCGCNASVWARTLRFYKGVRGLARHVREKHKDEAVAAFDDIIRTFKRRVVDDVDVKILKAGGEPNHPIVKYRGRAAPQEGREENQRPSEPVKDKPLYEQYQDIVAGSKNEVLQTLGKRKAADVALKGRRKTVDMEDENYRDDDEDDEEDMPLRKRWST